MPEDKITPEEKLLKIIEGTRSEKKEKVQFGVFKDKFGIGSGSLSKVTGLVKSIDLSKLKQFNLHTVNKALAVACLVITVLLVANFVITQISFSTKFKKIKEEGLKLNEGIKQYPKIDINLGEALAIASRRNIFSFIPPKAAEETSKPQISQAVANLKLVGILWSDKPQAMIEDSADKKTYLVGVKDKIRDIVIKQILSNKVILMQGDQQWDLR